MASWHCADANLDGLGQGITALIALNIIEQFDIKGMDLLGPQRLHVMTEALRLAS